MTSLERLLGGRPWSFLTFLRWKGTTTSTTRPGRTSFWIPWARTPEGVVVAVDGAARAEYLSIWLGVSECPARVITEETEERTRADILASFASGETRVLVLDWDIVADVDLRVVGYWVGYDCPISQEKMAYTIGPFISSSRKSDL